MLGLTATAAGKARERELRTVVRDLPKEVELWAGGRGAARHASIITPRGLVFGDYAAYQQELIRIGGRQVTAVMVRDTSFRLHLCVSSVLTAAAWIIVATPAAAQDTTGVGAIAGAVVSAGDQLALEPSHPEYPDRQSEP